MQFHTGQLLLATPRLISPAFFRTVVLLLDHDENGALGVVINRPSELPVGAVLPAWSSAVSEPRVLFAGGPVAPESALAVGIASGAGPAQGFKALAGGYGLIDLDADPREVAGDLAGARVFSGYAGWGTEQLEAEIVEGSWYVVNALPGDVLTDEPTSLWRAVLRRQPGELAYVATFPDDPSLN